MPTEEAARIGDLFQALTIRGEPFRDLEKICIHQDGTRRVLLTNGIPVFSQAGELLGYRGSDKDITEQKRLTSELARYQHQLEDMVGRRTAELEAANQRLRNSDIRLTAMFELSQRAADLSLEELLQSGIDEAARLTGSEIGYLHMVNEDQETLQMIAWSRGTLRYCTAVHDEHYPISRAGLWADSLRTLGAVIHNDYQGLGNRRGYPQGHAQSDSASRDAGHRRRQGAHPHGRRQQAAGL